MQSCNSQLLIDSKSSVLLHRLASYLGTYQASNNLLQNRTTEQIKVSDSLSRASWVKNRLLSYPKTLCSFLPIICLWIQHAKASMKWGNTRTTSEDLLLHNCTSVLRLSQRVCAHWHKPSRDQPSLTDLFMSSMLLTLPSFAALFATPFLDSDPVNPEHRKGWLETSLSALFRQLFPHFFLHLWSILSRHWRAG